MMTQIIQGTGVCFDNVGLLIMGAPGVGKTSLALALIDAGGVLVGDDGVCVTVENDVAVMSPVSTTRGMIEVRQVGIVSGMPVAERQKIDVVIRLETCDLPRLPDKLTMETVAGVRVPSFSLMTGDFSLTNKVKMIIKIVKRQISLEQTF